MFSFENDTLFVIKDADYTKAISVTTHTCDDNCKKASDATKASDILTTEFTKTSGFKIFTDLAGLNGKFYFVNVGEVKSASDNTTVTSYKANSIVYEINGGVATWTMGSGIEAGGTIPTDN